jgi:GT2 family glycosyltransferase/glycosyltransferase involved in cell wall biosynthesis
LAHDLLNRAETSTHFINDDTSELADLVSELQAITPQRHVADSLEKAVKAIRREDLEGALATLLYTQRLAPSNRMVTLFIGDLRLAMRRPEAAEAFEFIAKHNNWRGAWYRLAYSRFLQGQPIQAAAELHRTLSRNAPVIAPWACSLCAEIASATLSMGWCGASNSGRLLIGGSASYFDMEDLGVEIDGIPIRLGRRSNRNRRFFSSYSLPATRAQGAFLKVTAKGVPLLGSPVDLQSVMRTEGFVSADQAGVQGWIWFPGEPDVTPKVEIADLDSGVLVTHLVPDLVQSTSNNAENLIWPRRFSLSLAKVPQSRLKVSGPHKKVLNGSPQNPWGTIRSGMVSTKRISKRYPALGEPEVFDGDLAAETSVLAVHRGLPPETDKQKRDRTALVVIPVYRGFDTTIACLQSVLEHRTSDQQILVVSDASPDKKLVRALESYSAEGKITLILEQVNKGFPATVNIGLRRGAKAEQDVILLNSDTIVTEGWVSKLRQAAYAAGDVGTATPMSNAATILSYPHHRKANATPTSKEVQELASLCAEVNAGSTIDIPTAHGFCMYIKYDCLIETGVLRDETFGHGYGEENDFSMRAQHLGWRHVAVPGSFVGHIEGQSFATAKDNLVARNLMILNTLHPGYDALIIQWQNADPLAGSRRRIDQRRWVIAQGDRRSVCFITHDREGGVLRHVQSRAEKSESDGYCSIICKPALDTQNNLCCLLNSPSGSFPNLLFRVDTESDLLEAFLKECQVSFVEVHHFIGHDESVVAIASRLSVPYDVHIHDYSWFCPRITLTAVGNRYCGEPPVSECVKCIGELGSNLGFSISPYDLIARSGELFKGARSVIFPSEDTARRFRARFPITATVEPWEVNAKPLKIRQVARYASGSTRRVCIVGAIGYEKGYDVILGCARLAAEKDLPIEFRIVGFTCDDERLLQTGKVKITGRYEEQEAMKLIKDQEADFALLPALWPETWSYVVSQLWEAELLIVAFDIGAPSERIKARGGGLLLPLGAPIERIVQWLLEVNTDVLQPVGQKATLREPTLARDERLRGIVA